MTISQGEFTRLSVEAMAALEAYASQQIGNRPMTKLEADMLCYCAVGCPTLLAVIQRASDFCEMLGERISRLELEVTGDRAACG